MTVTDQPATVPGYRFILPPGWVRIPLDERCEEVLRDELAVAVPRSLGDSAAAKARLRTAAAVRPALDDAKRAGGRDVYVPLRGMHGLAVPASFVVSEFAATDVDALTVLRARASRPSADVVDVVGVEAVRSEALEVRDAPDGATVRTRTVVYALHLRSVDRLILLTFSTLGDGDPAGSFADLLVDLFDAIVGTLRFDRD